MRRIMENTEYSKSEGSCSMQKINSTTLLLPSFWRKTTLLTASGWLEFENQLVVTQRCSLSSLFLINQSVLSLKCREILKHTHHIFPKPYMMSSDVSLSPATSSNPSLHWCVSYSWKMEQIMSQQKALKNTPYQHSDLVLRVNMYFYRIYMHEINMICPIFGYAFLFFHF